MGDPWGIRGFRGWVKPNIKQIVKKKLVKNSQKSAKSEKNRKNQIFFFNENGLKCIRNPTKHLQKSTICQKKKKKKKKKIGEIVKNSEKSDFFSYTFSNALGTPRNTLKSQKLVKRNIKSRKIALG